MAQRHLTLERRGSVRAMLGLAVGLLGTLAVAHTTAQEPLERRLYVANDAERRFDVYDIDKNHALHHSFTPEQDGVRLLDSRCRGIAAHADTSRLYFTDSDLKHVVALDLVTEQVVWVRQFDEEECEHPDRLSVTVDGSALYVPCKLSDSMVVLDARDGRIIRTHTVNEDEAPHNTYTGERGEYMYLGSYRSPIFRVYDQKTHDLVRQIDGFSSGIRPFAVDPTETYFFANLTKLLGFGVGDVRAGRRLFEVEQATPAERLAHPEASGGHPHGGKPKSHGLALRPGTNEVWFLDDEWGYLYVYDTSPLPDEAPRHLATIPLFTDISKPYYRAAEDIDGAGDGYWRWLTFSIDGRWAYPANGAVVDAERRRLTPMTVTASEKQLHVDFRGGVPVAVGGQNGGVYPRSTAAGTAAGSGGN